MFSRVVTFFFILVAGCSILATANDQCSTGEVQCCNSLQSSTTTGLAQTLAGGGLLGIQINAILQNVNGLVGLACFPLSILALGGNSCSTQPVCCTNNYIGGIIQAGCTPVNV